MSGAWLLLLVLAMQYTLMLSKAPAYVLLTAAHPVVLGIPCTEQRHSDVLALLQVSWLCLQAGLLLRCG
jgi:hypothetical protein